MDSCYRDNKNLIIEKIQLDDNFQSCFTRVSSPYINETDPVVYIKENAKNWGKICEKFNLNETLNSSANETIFECKGHSIDQVIVSSLSRLSEISVFV